VGYFQGDAGTINQLVHLWKFHDDADRRNHWAGVYATSSIPSHPAAAPISSRARSRRSSSSGSGDRSSSRQDRRRQPHRGRGGAEIRALLSNGPEIDLILTVTTVVVRLGRTG
jgi:hypothetical protein